MRRVGSLRLLLVTGTFLLCEACWSQGQAAEATPSPPPRVLVVEKPAAAPGGGVMGDFLDGAKLFEVRRAAAGAVEDDLMKWAEVVVVGEGGIEGGEEEAAKLLDAATSGKGVVVSGVAAWGLARSSAYSRLLGREPAAGGGAVAGEAPAAVRLGVAVRDQSHPVTQCITHFRHRGTLGRAKLVLGAALLAAALVEAGPGAGEAPGGGEAGAAAPPPAPLVWTVSHGAGRVLVTGLDFREGPSRGIARTILARAVEWVAGRQVTVKLEGEIALAPDLAPERGFFRGRQIAPVMSYHAADWLTRAEREETEQPEKVLDSLDLKPGMTVADLGAGVGYFSIRMARRVGPGGKVLAVEVQEEMLNGLKENALKQGIANVEPILATEKDPRLGADAADLVLMVDVYHELSHPEEVMGVVRKALRAKGRLVLVEYRGEDPSVPIKPVHRTTLAQMRSELEALGFRWLEVKEFLPQQRIIIAGKG